MTDATIPPTSPLDDDFDLHEPPKWPKVVGIISLVMAGLSLTCTGCGVVSILVFIPMGESAMGEPMPAVMRPGGIVWVLFVVGFLMIGLLTVAGIHTIMRRRSGRLLHLIWGGVSIPLALGNAAYQLMQQNAVADWVAQNPDSPWAAQQGQGAGFQIIGLIIGLLIGLGYPVFCVIWFGLIKTKHEQMTGGAEDVY